MIFKEDRVKIKSTECAQNSSCDIIEIFNCQLRRVDSFAPCLFLLLKIKKSSFQFLIFCSWMWPPATKSDGPAVLPPAPLKTTNGSNSHMTLQRSSLQSKMRTALCERIIRMTLSRVYLLWIYLMPVNHVEK